MQLIFTSYFSSRDINFDRNESSKADLKDPADDLQW